MSDPDSLLADEPDITVSVAMKTALRVAVVFLSLYLLQRFADFATHVPPTLEAILRVFAVIAIARSVSRSERRRFPYQDLSRDAFLSTAFFYGITLATVYAIQIGVMAFELLGDGTMTVGEEIRFVLGIQDFSSKGIVMAFVLSHLPYFAYYWVVRSAK